MGRFTMSELKQTEQYQITWLIRRLFRQMAQTADSYLESLGINSGERAVLEFLSNEQTLTVPQIAENYGVSRQHIQVTVNHLLELGLVAYEPNPAHKRSQFVVLTDRGIQLFAEITERDAQAVTQLFGNISKRDYQQTRETLQHMLNNLSQLSK